ncbi:MAG: BlaB/IND/MUS family subclass B1 metallo-beta-lactamase [Niastella sp.]|nr:BlaB/IND/MUS family subclass B1 metallo-beta-lactamase [Niastella sp.]
MRKIILALTCFLLFSNIFGQDIHEKLKITHVTGDFYVYTTYNTYQDSQVPANGMYIVTNNGVVMLDTPWDTTQFQPLLDSIKIKHHKVVVMCIATHWHSDKTAGLAYYKNKGINTYTTSFTDELCKLNNKNRAEYLIYHDTTFHVGKYSFETYYPGQGHSADNIVIWFNHQKILYAGCLVKAADAEDLGYLGDGNTTAYASTLRKIKIKYAHPKYIIISHGDWKNINSLNHSIILAKKLQKKSQQ